MTPPSQLIIVETLFASSKRSSYVLVLPKAAANAASQTPEQEAVAFSLGLSHTQTPAEAAAIFVLSRHDDVEAAFHCTREGALLEAEDVMKRPPDEESATAQMWLVAEFSA